MNHWGRIITAFYILVVGSLNGVFAVLIAAVGAKEGESTDISQDIWRLYTSGEDGAWAFWSWCLLLVGGPLVLLLVRIDPSRLKVQPRWPVLISAIAAGLAFAILCGTAAINLLLAFAGNNGLGDGTQYIILECWLIAWALWAFLLWHMGARILDPAGRLYRWLIAGSVLELLVAVPTHIIVNRRHECTAPYVTSFGVATGLAMLLMSVGPGVVFLYRARMRRAGAARRAGKP